jgi:hypothetical protein
MKRMLTSAECVRRTSRLEQKKYDCKEDNKTVAAR